MPRTPTTCTASRTASFPLIAPSPSPLDVIMTYDSDPDSDPYPFHDIIAYRPPTIRPLPLTLTIRTAICYWLIPHCMMDISLISDVLYNAVTHLGLRRLRIFALPRTTSLVDPYSQ